MFNNSFVFNSKSSKSIEFDFISRSLYSLYISPVLDLLDSLSDSVKSEFEKYALTEIKLFFNDDILFRIVFGLYESLSKFISLIIDEINLSES